MVALDLPTAALLILGIVVVLVAILAVIVVKELSKDPPKGGTPVTLPNGMKIMQWQKGETDFLFTEIFGYENAYARGEITFRPGATIIDAGANIGMFSLFAAMQCRGDAKIISFEPIPTTHAVLSANATSANKGEYDHIFKARPGAKLDIVPLNVGLSDAPASVTFEHHPHFSVWSTSDPKFAAERLLRIKNDLPRAAKSNESWLVRVVPSFVVSLLGNMVLEKMGRTEKIPAKLITLSSVFEQHKVSTVDVLKVDVEGAELLVLRGIEDRHWDMIQQVVMEVENFDTVRRVTDLLKSKGFETSSFASERERNPDVLSEVSMLYGVRPAYKAKHTGKATQ